MNPPRFTLYCSLPTILIMYHPELDEGLAPSYAMATEGRPSYAMATEGKPGFHPELTGRENYQRLVPSFFDTHNALMTSRRNIAPSGFLHNTLRSL